MSIAFLAFAGAVHEAVAQDRMMRGPGGPGGMGPGGPEGMLERADTDGDGAISFEEFAFSMGNGLTDADLNGDGRITTEEIVENIVRTRVRPMAENMMRRFDRNGDGVLTLEEINAQQREIFDRMDRNGDGKIDRSELPRGRGQRP